MEEETHPCSEIVINIWSCVPAPALLFHKICYTAAKIAHLQASFLQVRKRDMSHVFHVHFDRMVFIMACSLLLITVEYPACTLCSLALLLTHTPPSHKIDGCSVLRILGHILDFALSFVIEKLRVDLKSFLFHFSYITLQIADAV